MAALPVDIDQLLNFFFFGIKLVYFGHMTVWSYDSIQYKYILN